MSSKGSNIIICPCLTGNYKQGSPRISGGSLLHYNTMKKYYIHLMSKNGHQTLCYTETGNEKHLAKLELDGWIKQLTKEYTDLETAKREKILLLNSMDGHGRPIV